MPASARKTGPRKAGGRKTGERAGVLVTWNDARGFGFIRPDDGSEDVFVHIASFGRGVPRPIEGVRIAFVMGPGRGGRDMAARVRQLAPAASDSVWASVLGRLSLLRFKLRRRESRIIMAAGLTLLALWAVLIGQAPLELLGPYLGMGIVAVLFYRADKWQARTNSWRVPETTLHATDLMFGIIGGLLAQGLYSHKTAKKSYVEITGMIVVGHIALLLAVGTGRPTPEDITHLKTLVIEVFNTLTQWL